MRSTEDSVLPLAFFPSPRLRQKSGHNSLFATTVRDGGCNFEIVAIAVHPDYQRQGLGRQVMDAVMAFFHEAAPESAYVDLIADHHSPALYSKYGNEPVAPKSLGIARTHKR